MRKINILHTIDSNETGGAETVFLKLIEYLNTDRYNFIIVLSGHGWLYTKVTEMGYSPIVLNTDGSFLFNYLISLIKIYKTHKIDLVHSHLFGANLYTSIAGMICRVPVISTFHGDADLSSDDTLLRLRLRIINIGSKKIVFVSKHLKNFVLSKFPLNSNKLNVIYNGIDLNKWTHDCTKDEKLKESLGFRKNHFLIGSIGDVRPAKGYHMLLEAAVDVLNHTPECRFVIAGNTETETYHDLLKLRKDFGLDDKVHFLGFREDVLALLKIFDIFVLPSISEGFSISTVEAMASGVPTVATKSGGPTEIITNGIDGILVDAADPASIAKGIIELISKDNLRTILAQHAKATAHKKFSVQNMIRSYEKLYTELISK